MHQCLVWKGLQLIWNVSTLTMLPGLAQADGRPARRRAEALLGQPDPPGARVVGMGLQGRGRLEWRFPNRADRPKSTTGPALASVLVCM